jgi:hypothetical protein
VRQREEAQYGTCSLVRQLSAPDSSQLAVFRLSLFAKNFKALRAGMAGATHLLYIGAAPARLLGPPTAAALFRSFNSNAS